MRVPPGRGHPEPKGSSAQSEPKNFLNFFFLIKKNFIGFRSMKNKLQILATVALHVLIFLPCPDGVGY